MFYPATVKGAVGPWGRGAENNKIESFILNKIVLSGE